jgi:hypothetical protein
MDREQARHAAAFFVLAADEVPGALGRDEQDVDVGGGVDGLEVEVEPVGDADRFPRLQMRFDRLVVHLRLHLVGQADDDEVALPDGVLDRHRVKPVLDRQPAIGAVTPVGDDDLHPAVAQVERMGVPLRPEPDDGDRFALEGVDRCVLLVDHL